jgi:hypothetical protein
MAHTQFGLRDLPTLPAKRPFVGEHPIAQRFRDYGEAGTRAIREPFVGITTDGAALPGLYAISATGVSTRPLVDAAQAFIAALDAEQRRRVQFGLDDSEWRAWSNIHPFIMRHGVPLDECSTEQREAGLALLRASTSARGFDLARDVMRLNDALGEITGRPEEYGEWYYWLSIFGEPSTEAPWGWQLDGHHLIVNCFVLGDQVVISPTFFGSEPTSVATGKHAGTRVFEAEERTGLAFARGLSAAQREVAIPSSTEGALLAQRMDGRVQTAAFRDNRVMPYVGLAGREMDSQQRRALLDLVAIYTGRMPEGHAELRLEEIAHHLEETRFFWVGGLDDNAVFYYRIQSPVVLIEFDHLSGIAFDNEEPTRNHIHTVARTPNGGDYGKDLLRQHYARHHAHGA